MVYRLANHSVKSLLHLEKEGYLHDLGWARSFSEKKPIDAGGNPLPWNTYSYIDFISQRLLEDYKIFEYGAGYSTLFYSIQVHNIFAVEHNAKWFDELNNLIDKERVKLFQENDEEQFAAFPLSLDTKFEIVIVDGIVRNACVRCGVSALSSSGVLILDDTDRPEYIESVKFLKENGFKVIEFTGLSPGSRYKKSTSVFYRQNNILGI